MKVQVTQDVGTYIYQSIIAYLILIGGAIKLFHWVGCLFMTCA